MADIPERDWKTLRSFEKDVLDLACRRILDKAQKIIAGGDTDAHTKYCDLFRMLRSEDRSIARMFNDLRRSSALTQVSMWKADGLLTDEQFKRFSQETRERISRLAESL